VVTHQLQVERRTGKVRQSETGVIPLCHATNYYCSIMFISGCEGRVVCGTSSTGKLRFGVRVGLTVQIRVGCRIGSADRADALLPSRTAQFLSCSG